jgi:RimJ/RimL family protein N-acetyltransferase
MRTNRLVLEPMLRSDAGEMFPLLSDSRLYEFTGGEPPSSVTSLAELYGWRDSREAVGYAQATVHPSHAYVAWVIGTSWQGRGYASESAGRLVRWLRSVGVPEIRACVNPAHAASGTVALRAGLRRTGEVQDGEEMWICRRPPLPGPDS